MTVIVRAERKADYAQVRALNLAAFSPSSVEADIVDALRDEVSPVVSLVAEHGGAVIGHILFSPVTIATAPQCRLMGLGPMAVAAEHRNRGVGTALRMRVLYAAWS